MINITADSPPTLLAHGSNDAHVWYVQSVAMRNELAKNNIKNYLLTIPWGTHGFAYNLNGPCGRLAMYSVEQFFKSVTQMKK